MKTTTSLALLAFATVCLADEPLKTVPIETGKAAELNREALEAFKKGDLKLAQALNDKAFMQDQSDPRHWLNGALYNLELGKVGQANRALQQASLMADRSFRRITLQAEVDTAKRQLGKGWRSIELGEFYSPEDPYLHTARATWADAAGEARIRERSRWQAYRLGRAPLLDSRIYNASSVNAGGGASAALHGSAKIRQIDDSIAGVGGLVAGGQTIGGRSKAKQVGWQADFSAATPIGAVMGSYTRAQHDRPGALPGASAFLQTPGARLDQKQFLIGIQPKVGHYTFNVNFREIDARTRANSSAPMVRDSLTRQWMLESRYDSGPVTLGAGLSEVLRSGTAAGFEPLEDRFGTNGTRLAHGYAVHRWNPDKNVRLISGVVVTKVDNTTHLLGTAELAVRIFADQFLRIGVKPTMNRAGTVLFPEDLRARSLVRYPNSSPWQTPGSNTALSWLAPQGKSMDMTATVPLASTPSSSASLSLFQKQFTSARFASGDPELQYRINPVPVSKGKITGATLSGSHIVSPGLEFSASFTLQTSRANIPLPVNSTDVPLVPRSAASFTADYALGDWMASASLEYVGPRTFFGPPDGQATKTQRLGGASVINFSLSRPVGSRMVRFDALNLGRVSLFPDFGASSSYQLSFVSKF